MICRSRTSETSYNAGREPTQLQQCVSRTRRSLCANFDPTDLESKAKFMHFLFEERHSKLSASRMHIPSCGDLDIGACSVQLIMSSCVVIASPDYVAGIMQKFQQNTCTLLVKF